MSDIHCPFRFNVQSVRAEETASCGLLQQISGSNEPIEVTRGACESCSEWFSDVPLSLNPVLPSLLFGVCDELLSRTETSRQITDPSAEQTAQRLVALRDEAEAWLVSGDQQRWPPTYSCDVIVCCEDDSEVTVAAIQSVLEQERVYPIVHIVVDCGRANGLRNRFPDATNVVFHRNDRRLGVYASMQALIPHCKTPFIAIQDSQCLSRPDRLVRSLRLVDDLGAEALATAIEVKGQVIRPERPDSSYRRFIAPETLVVRRSTLIDMGGLANRPDADVEWFYRATIEQRRVILMDDAAVSCIGERNLVEPGPIPSYGRGRRSLREFSTGFAYSRVACDVVLPFFGHVDYVEQALTSIIDQDEADVVVHLIDDASVEDTSAFLNRWRGHPSVRAYRNVQNIGQFASFNNVVPFLESEFVAVQDGDDISLPRRLYSAVNQLQLGSGDVFGSAVEIFGDSQVKIGTSGGLGQTVIDADRLRLSMYPKGENVSYYLENPTKVMRVDVFKQLGGYADYRDRIKNRTGLDTEFMARAYHAGAAIAISNDVLLKYRVHGDSATQNDVSGWGTDARSASQIENRRRRKLFRQGPFDPRMFGGLKNHMGITKRLRGSL